jgi:hypothetical protein
MLSARRQGRRLGPTGALREDFPRAFPPCNNLCLVSLAPSTVHTPAMPPIAAWQAAMP